MSKIGYGLAATLLMVVAGLARGENAEPSTRPAAIGALFNSELQLLSLGNTQVTDAGVAELRKALPGCDIVK